MDLQCNTPKYCCIYETFVRREHNLLHITLQYQLVSLAILKSLDLLSWGTEIGFTSSHAGLLLVCLCSLDLFTRLLSNGTDTISVFLLSPSRQSGIGI